MRVYVFRTGIDSFFLHKRRIRYSFTIKAYLSTYREQTVRIHPGRFVMFMLSYPYTREYSLIRML